MLQSRTPTERPVARRRTGRILATTLILFGLALALTAGASAAFAAPAAAPLGITVTAPTGTSSYAAGASLTVSWTTSSATSSGELGIWARSAGGAWYIGKLVPANGLAACTTTLTLDAPAGKGCQAIVAYRSVAGSGA